MTTASISTATNSSTDVATACGWSCTCTELMPGGQVLCHGASGQLCSALPSAMMSPPLAIDTPSAMTSLPWWRTLTDGGSA